MDEDKGAWAEVADDGIVPTEKDDRRRDRRGDRRRHPRDEDGIDLTAGDNADATTDGGGDKCTQRPQGRDAALVNL